MRDRPLVSLIIIAFNQERYVREAIEGAFAQTYSPLEIILSDDNSPDTTFRIMQEMAAAYVGPHRLVLNRNDRNLGLVPHIDRAMSLAKGRFVVINAGDDVSTPERTARIVEAWEDSGRTIRLVHSPAIEMDDAGRQLGLRTSPKAMIENPTPFAVASDRNFILGATLAWDRAIFDEFGPLGSELSVEDTIIPFRAALLGGIGYVDEPLVLYRTGGMSSAIGPRVTPRDYLYGLSHKLRKWQIRNDLHILTRFANVPYHGKDVVESACRKRSELLALPVDLAEAPFAHRPRFAPRAVWLSLRHRTAEPLKHWAMYALEPLYLRYAHAKSWVMARARG